ncbi:hypothetical protein GWK47_035576 [Chionoecetes opilio]|uniref:Uncharacterized protein n=1 Tax=Chionoecetes opilio TaxID=41210 RepID=A0A8J5D062_CHIOP|nr:hypothetical protein GWK47_035576 [Chionoecetes opilio]
MTAAVILSHSMSRKGSFRKHMGSLESRQAPHCCCCCLAASYVGRTKRLPPRLDLSECGFAPINPPIHSHETRELRHVVRLRRVRVASCQARVLSSVEDTARRREETAQHPTQLAGVCTTQRWVQILTHLKARDVSHQRMSELVQFIHCLLGTNASERTLSHTNKKDMDCGHLKKPN